MNLMVQKQPPIGHQYNVVTSLLLVLFFLLAPFSSLLAQTASPHLSLNPTVREVDAGFIFNVTVSVNTGGQSTNGVDAIVQYTSTLLEVVNVTEGTFFPTITTITTTAGKIEIYGVADTGSPKTGTGTLATITFRGRAPGTASVGFLCQPGGTNDSNINSTNNTDIIVCPSNINASYVIGGQAATPAANLTGEDLPKTGFLEPTTLIFGGGMILMFLGLTFIFKFN